MKSLSNRILSFSGFLSESSNIKEKAGISIIFNNKILLVHPAGKDFSIGKCSIPKGGINPNEDILFAALRELKEETGIVLQSNKLDPSPEIVYLYDEENNISGQLTYYICKIKSLSEIGLTSEMVPTNQLQQSEVNWAKFLSAKEAYPLINRSQSIILDRHLLR